MSVAVIPVRCAGKTRWEPNAAGRLSQAALELYAERGFDRTTVAEIAERAGLTERTFFRHFADKREVLFAGSERLREELAAATAAAPAGASPLDAVAAGLASLAEFFEATRPYSERRNAVVAASVELQERELIKRASLVVAVTGALHARGVPEPEATLAAEAGLATFHIAYGRWVLDPDRRPYDEHVRRTIAELRAVCAVASQAPAEAPVATGRAGSAHHSLHEPG